MEISSFFNMKRSSTVFVLFSLVCSIKSAIINSHLSEFNYMEALDKSLLFYEAQRSGKLPPDNRIPWRGDSALDDKGNNGEDLTGGYYESSDYVKFIGVQAATGSLLAWGLLEGSQGYKKANLTQRGLECLKWVTDFLIKCHVAPNELYVQVGDFNIDFKFWGRPEELNETRPAFKLDPDHPGSDLAGEASAALAAASIVFKKYGDKEYSELCLKHAKELYEFGSKYRGDFQLSLKNTAFFYNSSGYEDELAWAAIWLHRATKEFGYLGAAEFYYAEFDKDNYNFTFGNRVAGVQLLLAQARHSSDYVNHTLKFCDYQISNNRTKTPEGLIFVGREGVLNHAANIAFICLQAAKLNGNKEESYKSFAKSQIDYILGINGRSFVVGFGENPPKQPHHAASSCPDRPQPCGWNNSYLLADNPQILYGALVSGPDINDVFLDLREEYIYTDINIEFNAGFQGTLAILADLYQKESNYIQVQPTKKPDSKIEFISDVKIEEDTYTKFIKKSPGSQYIVNRHISKHV